MVETIRVFQQFSPGTVFAVFLVRCLKEVTHEVRHTINHIRFRTLYGLLPDKEVETVVVVPCDSTCQLVLLGEQAVGDAPLVAVGASLYAARLYRLAYLPAEAVAFRPDSHTTGKGALHLQPGIVTYP